MDIDLIIGYFWGLFGMGLFVSFFIWLLFFDVYIILFLKKRMRIMEYMEYINSNFLYYVFINILYFGNDCDLVEKIV